MSKIEGKLIRVLHIVHSMNAGGIETFIMNVYRNINREKVQFDFLINTQEKCFYDDEIEELGGKKYIIYTPYRPIITWKYKQELKNFFQEHKEYNVIHCHRNATSVYALEQAYKCGVPVRIAHSHIANTKLSIKTPFDEWNKLFIKNYATHWFACSSLAGQWLYGKDDVLDKRFKIIPNAIDLSRFSYSEETRNALRKQLELDKCFAVGHVGRFTKQKNHEFLIDVFTELYKREPTSRLILLGQGPLEKKIQEKCAQNGISDVVKFVGIKGETEKYYNAMDLFLFPSIYEGLGIVAVEAQATGLPVIASDKVPKEAGVTGNFFQMELRLGIDEWVEKILEMRKQGTRKSYSEEISKRGYDISDTANYLEHIYLMNGER